jgi:hypothetical protein
MARWATIAAGAFVFALVASQILLPNFGERRIQERLTAGGGTAEVTLGAVPAARLLFNHGERFEVTARDLALDLDHPEPVFSKLDGFANVDISIASSKAGPFAIDEFELTRDAPGPYHLVSSGEASPEQLVDYGLEGVELPGTDFIGMLFGGLVAPADTAVPVDLDVELTSDRGRVRVVSGGGTVDGIPTGPLAELVTNAVIVRL